jgi:hypothetical protein
MTRLLITAAALGLTASSAFAFGTATIDANENVQASRIEDGRYKGELTRSEYRALKAEQGRIIELERQAKADGRVSKREYNEIHTAQINAYRQIKAESNDGQKSWWRRWLYNTRN